MIPEDLGRAAFGTRVAALDELAVAILKRKAEQDGWAEELFNGGDSRAARALALENWARVFKRLRKAFHAQYEKFWAASDAQDVQPESDLMP